MASFLNFQTGAVDGDLITNAGPSSITGQTDNTNIGVELIVNSTGSMEYDNAIASSGSVFGETFSVKVNSSATSGTNYLSKTVACSSVSATLTVRLSAASTGETSLIYVATGSGTRAWAVVLLATGALRLVNSSYGTIWTSTGTLAANTDYRIEASGISGAGTGSLRLAYYAGNSATPIQDSGTFTNQQAGGADYTSIRFGKAATGTFAVPFNMWRAGWTQNSTALIGPYVAPSVPPTGSATLYEGQAVIVATATAGQGGTLTYSISPTLNTTVLAPGIWRIVPPTDAAQVYTWTATESGTGLTATGTKSVAPSTTKVPAGMIEDLVFDGSWT